MIYYLIYQEDLPEIIELSDPDETPANQRRILRNENENKQFDSDRYIADFIDGRNDPIFIQAMGIYIILYIYFYIDFKPQYVISRKQLYLSQKHWCEENKSNDIPADFLEESSDILTKEDNDIICKLPKVLLFIYIYYLYSMNIYLVIQKHYNY